MTYGDGDLPKSGGSVDGERVDFLVAAVVVSLPEVAAESDGADAVGRLRHELWPTQGLRNVILVEAKLQREHRPCLYRCPCLGRR